MMQRNGWFWIALILGIIPSAIVAEEQGRTAPSAGWELLFNGRDLTGWHIFLQEHGKDRDPDGIVAIENGMIHLYKNAVPSSRVLMGYISTDKEWSDYHLRLEFKWGEKKFEPRLALPRDAGLYYHITGHDAVWPRSLQYQIQERDVADLIALYGVQCDSWFDAAKGGQATAEDMKEFLDPMDGGTPVVQGGAGLAYQKRRGMYELEGWNTAELIVRGTSTTYVLNGKMVNRVENIRLVDPADPKKSTPLSRGRIALEIEAAEIFYRNIEIRSLEEKPAPKIEVEPGLRIGAAAVNIPAEDSMVIAGGIGPWNPKGQEGELRATAVVIEKSPGAACAIVSCDVLFVTRDLIDSALEEIRKATGIPPENVMVSATHTHSAPSTVKVHGYGPEEKFRKSLREAIVKAVSEAHANLRGDCRFEFGIGADYSVGENSRLLLADNTIFWIGSREDAVRPTAPFDPELPVLAFRGKDGKLRATIFNHSTHTIGTLAGSVRSPSYYGLAAQDLERGKGGIFCFLEGASGSTHNLALTTAQCKESIQNTTAETLTKARPRPIGKIQAIRRPFKFHVRKFDEAVEQQKVESYCRKRAPQGADGIAAVFSSMRQELAPRQGEERETWLQVIKIGDVAIVGVPAEYFTALGIEIKRRSAFANTFVSELANDWIGYLPDRRGHEQGGYQTWMGLHSYAEVGTGEAVVDEVVRMLESLK